LVDKTSFLTGAKVELAKSESPRKRSLDPAARERRDHGSTSNLRGQVFSCADGRQF
jgi:hypothetical protein